MKNIEHIPTRTCVACGKLRPKQELIRLVRIDNGDIDIDNTSKMEGRGTYLCPIAECWEVGLRSSRIEYGLRVQLNNSNRERLIRYGKSLREGNK